MYGRGLKITKMEEEATIIIKTVWSASVITLTDKDIDLRLKRSESQKVPQYSYLYLKQNFTNKIFYVLIKFSKFKFCTNG